MRHSKTSWKLTTDRNFPGEFTLDGRPTRLHGAGADLFAGRVCLTFWQTEFRCLGTIRNIPFDDAVEFHQLAGKQLQLTNCLDSEFENGFKPMFQLGDDIDEVYGVSKLVVDSINYDSSKNLLSLHVALQAVRNDPPIAIEITVDATAECHAMNATSLVLHQESIPVRHAGYYLSLLGLPSIDSGAREQDVIDLYGDPCERGGGHHPTFGVVPDWIRYKTSTCLVRFALDAGVVDYVTIMPLS